MLFVCHFGPLCHLWATLRQLGGHRGWGHLEKTWWLFGSALGFNHQTWKTCTQVSLEHSPAAFVEKTIGFVMVLGSAN